MCHRSTSLSRVVSGELAKDSAQLFGCFANGCGFKYQLTRLNTPGMSTTHCAHFICKVIAFVWSHHQAR
ncbi:unnamed protein product [Sphagnum jensenii]|uniref:Uncharacterized protein n=1 Tax=Sphagnum jensenii TaxID=128206 RepID=A0ABP1BP62_9BRYO